MNSSRALRTTVSEEADIVQQMRRYDTSVLILGRDASRSGADGVRSPLHETVGTATNSRQRTSPNCLPSPCHRRPGLSRL